MRDDDEGRDGEEETRKKERKKDRKKGHFVAG